MKKSKHFRKDVIIARIIAAAILLALLVLLVLGISLLTKSSGEDKNSQSSQNTQQTENFMPGDEDEQDSETEANSEETTEEQPSEPGVDENDDTTYVPDKVYVKTTTQVRLREEPNTNCATLDRIDGGTKLEVLETLDGWYKVNYNGKEGYVSATYAKIVEE